MSYSEKQCKMCCLVFVPKSPRQSTCSDGCKKALRKQWNDTNNALVRDIKREANNKKYAAVYDIPTCVICGWKSTSLQGHLKTHNLTVAQYRQQYSVSNEQIFHSSYTSANSARISGEKNPGYQHGGKMSSFSTKNSKYVELSDSEKRAAIDTQIIKANVSKRANNSYANTVEYYTSRGFSNEEAVCLVKQRQRTFTLEKCIEKHGEKDGYKRWLDRQQRWLDSAGMKQLHRGVSKISQEMFQSIHALYQQPCFYATNGGDGVNNEYQLRTKRGYVLPDFFAPGIVCKIIEFDGDYWHSDANPRNICSIARDAKIKESYPSYQILHIYEREYKKDKERTIKKCLDFLNN